MNKLAKIIVVSGLALVTALQAQVDINTQSLQLVLEKDKKVWKPATRVVPGTVIKYVNTVTNDDKEVANDLVVVNNISKYMELVPNTVACSDECDITYAVDLKEGYKKPSELYIVDPKTKLRRLAKPSEYVSIKWVIDTLDKNAVITVQYESKLK
jgi:uncharacterized repeat protein (TIGR01451 family)